MTLGRSLELALLVRSAAHALEHDRDARPRAAALRFAAHGVDLIRDEDRTLSSALANDFPLTLDT
jgi:acyl-CoA dehydrogenase